MDSTRDWALNKTPNDLDLSAHSFGSRARNAYDTVLQLRSANTSLSQASHESQKRYQMAVDENKNLRQSILHESQNRYTEVGTLRAALERSYAALEDAENRENQLKSELEELKSQNHSLEHTVSIQHGGTEEFHNSVNSLQDMLQDALAEKNELQNNLSRLRTEVTRQKEESFHYNSQQQELREQFRKAGATALVYTLIFAQRRHTAHQYAKAFLRWRYKTKECSWRSESLDYRKSVQKSVARHAALVVIHNRSRWRAKTVLNAWRHYAIASRARHRLHPVASNHIRIFRTKQFFAYWRNAYSVRMHIRSRLKLFTRNLERFAVRYFLNTLKVDTAQYYQDIHHDNLVYQQRLTEDMHYEAVHRLINIQSRKATIRRVFVEWHLFSSRRRLMFVQTVQALENANKARAEKCFQCWKNEIRKMVKARQLRARIGRQLLYTSFKRWAQATYENQIEQSFIQLEDEANETRHFIQAQSQTLMSRIMERERKHLLTKTFSQLKFMRMCSKLKKALLKRTLLAFSRRQTQVAFAKWKSFSWRSQKEEKWTHDKQVKHYGAMISHTAFACGEKTAYSIAVEKLLPVINKQIRLVDLREGWRKWRRHTIIWRTIERAQRHAKQKLKMKVFYQWYLAHSWSKIDTRKQQFSSVAQKLQSNYDLNIMQLTWSQWWQGIKHQRMRRRYIENAHYRLNCWHLKRTISHWKTTTLKDIGTKKQYRIIKFIQSSAIRRGLLKHSFATLRQFWIEKKAGRRAMYASSRIIKTRSMLAWKAFVNYSLLKRKALHHSRKYKEERVLQCSFSKWHRLITRNRQKTFMTKGAGKALAKSKLEQGYLLAAYKTDKCLYSAFKKWTAFVHANKTLSVANAHPKVRQAKALKALDWMVKVRLLTNSYYRWKENLYEGRVETVHKRLERTEKYSSELYEKHQKANSKLKKLHLIATNCSRHVSEKKLLLSAFGSWARQSSKSRSYRKIESVTNFCENRHTKIMLRFCVGLWYNNSQLQIKSRQLCSKVLRIIKLQALKRQEERQANKFRETAYRLAWNNWRLASSGEVVNSRFSKKLEDIKHKWSSELPYLNHIHGKFASSVTLVSIFKTVDEAIALCFPGCFGCLWVVDSSRGELWSVQRLFTERNGQSGRRGRRSSLPLNSTIGYLPTSNQHSGQPEGSSEHETAAGVLHQGSSSLYKDIALGSEEEVTRIWASFGESIVGSVARTNEVDTIQDATKDVRYNPAVDIPVKFSLRQQSSDDNRKKNIDALTVPISLSTEKIFGVIQVAGTRKLSSAQDINRLSLIANFAMAAIDRFRYASKIRQTKATSQHLLQNSEESMAQARKTISKYREKLQESREKRKRLVEETQELRHTNEQLGKALSKFRKKGQSVVEAANKAHSQTKGYARELETSLTKVREDRDKLAESASQVPYLQDELERTQHSLQEKEDEILNLSQQLNEMSSITEELKQSSKQDQSVHSEFYPGSVHQSHNTSMQFIRALQQNDYTDNLEASNIATELNDPGTAQYSQEGSRNPSYQEPGASYSSKGLDSSARLTKTSSETVDIPSTGEGNSSAEGHKEAKRPRYWNRRVNVENTEQEGGGPLGPTIPSPLIRDHRSRSGGSEEQNSSHSNWERFAGGVENVLAEAENVSEFAENLSRSFRRNS